MTEADLRMHRFLDLVDDLVDRTGLADEVWPGDRPSRLVTPSAPSKLHLRTEKIGAVVLAAGYRPDYPWLRLPITAPDGSIIHHRGVTAAPGVYVVGLRYQNRRDSSFIDGARHDARIVVEHLLRDPDATVSPSTRESAT